MSELKFDNIKVGEKTCSIFPENFVLPDMPEPKEGISFNDFCVNFIFQHGERKYQALFEITRYAKSDQNWLGRIRFLINNPDNNEFVAHFNANITKDSARKEDQDSSPRVTLMVYTRKVDSKYRKKGLGELGLLGLEEITKKIGDKYPELKVEQIEMFTGLSSLSRLIIDQGWLVENGLEYLKKSKGENLGYFPAKAQKNLAILLLQKNIESMEQVGKEVSEEEYEQVRFSKILS